MKVSDLKVEGTVWVVPYSSAETHNTLYKGKDSDKHSKVTCVALE